MAGHNFIKINGIFDPSSMFSNKLTLCFLIMDQRKKKLIRELRIPILKFTVYLICLMCVPQGPFSLKILSAATTLNEIDQLFRGYSKS